MASDFFGLESQAQGEPFALPYLAAYRVFHPRDGEPDILGSASSTEPEPDRCTRFRGGMPECQQHVAGFTPC